MKRVLPLVIAAFVCGLLLGVALFRKDGQGRADRSSPAVRDESSTPAPPPEGPGDVVRGPASADVRRNLRDQIRHYYRARKREEIPGDLLADAMRTVDAEFEKDLASRLASIAAEHENRRGIYGEMRDASNMLLQARDSLATLLPHESLQADAPLDLDAAVRDRAIHVQGGGAIPPGRVLVIEGAEIEARLGDDRRGGGVWVNLGHAEALAQPDLRTRLRVRFEGRAIVPPGFEGRVSLRTQNGAASLRIKARLVTVEEAKGLRPERFRWVAEGSEGFVSSRPVVIQVMADHGGGNQRRACLDGSDNGRFDARATAPFFDTATKVDALSRSLVYYEGEGLIPPGKAWVVTRIEYRGRLSVERGIRSDMALQVNGHSILKTHAKESPEPAGVWQGRIVVPAGRERKVSLALSYFGVGEARFFGELIDAPR